MESVKQEASSTGTHEEQAVNRVKEELKDEEYGFKKPTQGPLLPEVKEATHSPSDTHLKHEDESQNSGAEGDGFKKPSLGPALHVPRKKEHMPSNDSKHGDEDTLPIKSETKSSIEESDNSEPPSTDETADSKQQMLATINKTFPPPLTDDHPPLGEFWFEVLKLGSIIERIDIVKSRMIVGRHPGTDIRLEHASVSRFHAVVLWSPKSNRSEHGNLILIDLNSTHGTYVNKTRIPPNKFIPLEPGNCVIKFGDSTRLFTLMKLHMPDEELEDEKAKEINRTTTKSVKREEDGCLWGIADDAEEDDVEEERRSDIARVLEEIKNKDLEGEVTNNEHVYSSDPQKTLRKWFEQEGYEFEFRVDELHQKYKCRIDLPIDGQDLTVEGDACTKKKEALASACLKACKLLDRTSLLFPWQREAARAEKRKANEEEEEEDTDMIDETAQAAIKRAKREATRTSEKKAVDTVDTLTEKLNRVRDDIAELRSKMEAFGSSNSKDPATESLNQGGSVLDTLDSFMETLKTQKSTGTLSISQKIEKSKLKYKIMALEKEESKLLKLIKIAQPSVVFPELKPSATFQTPSPVASRVHEQDMVPSSSSEPSERDNNQSTANPDPQTLENEDRKPTIDKGQSEASQTRPSFHTEGSGSSKSQPAAKHDKPAKIVMQMKAPKTLSKPSSSATFAEPSTSSKTNPTRQSIAELLRERQQELERQELKKSESKLFEADDNYVEWVPPTNQSGDGTTHLNQKYGY